jgi:hypothetical protein
LSQKESTADARCRKTFSNGLWVALSSHSASV